jgi:hypothetical protein
MSELTTQQMIDTIRKGDKLGHDFLQAVADRLGNQELDLLTCLAGAGESEAFAKAHIHDLEADNERMREALRFYAEGDWNDNYPGGVVVPNTCCTIDTGSVAKKALQKK